MFCTQCGAQNPDSNSFCTKCGSRLATVPSTSQAQSSPQVTSAEPGQTTQIASGPASATAVPQGAPFAAGQQQASAQPGFSAQHDPRYTTPISQNDPAPQSSQNPTPANQYVAAQQPQATQQHAPQTAAQPQTKSVHEIMGASQPMAQVAPNGVQGISSSISKPRRTRNNGKLIILIAAFLIILLGIVIAAFVTDGFGLIKVTPKNSVNEYTWGELSKIANEISKAKSDADTLDIAKNYNLVGSSGKLDGTQTKDITLSNGQKASVMITGFAHDNKVKGGKAGITFMFTDAIYSNSMNSSDSNSGGWEQSQMRSWLASDGMKMLPDDLQKAIIEVEKKTNNKGPTTDVSSVTTTTDKLWLFSPVEVCGPVNWNEKKDAAYDKVLNAEGNQYSVFKNMGIIDDKPNKPLIRKLNGEACLWWTRSPALSGNDGFYEGNKEGFMGAHLKASSSRGVVPGFCL